MTLEELETEIGKRLRHPEKQFLQQACRVLEVGLLNEVEQVCREAKKRWL